MKEELSGALGIDDEPTETLQVKIKKRNSMGNI